MRQTYKNTGKRGKVIERERETERDTLAHVEKFLGKVFREKRIYPRDKFFDA